MFCFWVDPRASKIRLTSLDHFDGYGLIVIEVLEYKVENRKGMLIWKRKREESGGGGRREE